MSEVKISKAKYIEKSKLQGGILSFLNVFQLCTSKLEIEGAATWLRYYQALQQV
jgi:hypothetical protein